MEQRVALERGVSHLSRVPITETLEDLLERARTLTDLYRVVAMLSPSDQRLALVEAAEGEAVRALEGLPAEQALVDLHHALLDAEGRLLEIEGAVPKAVFAQRFDAGSFDKTTLLRYAKALARRGSSHPDRPARVREVLGQLLLRSTEGGRIAMAERRDVDDVLAYVLGRASNNEEFRHVASQFFVRSSDRLVQAQTLADVFDSGVYADIIAFEVALRERLLDPEVLWGSLTLATFMSNRLGELAYRDGVGSDELFTKMLKVRAELEALFGEPAPEPSPGVRHPTPRPSSPHGKDTSKERHKTSQSQARIDLEKRKTLAVRLRKVVWASVVVGAIVACLAVYQFLFGTSRLAPDEMAQLSTQIVDGRVSNKLPRILEAHLDSQKWVSLSKEARREEANRIKDRLASIAHVQNAILFVGDRLAIQIEGSRLKYVE